MLWFGMKKKIDELEKVVQELCPHEDSDFIQLDIANYIETCRVCKKKLFNTHAMNENIKEFYERERLQNIKDKEKELFDLAKEIDNLKGTTNASKTQGSKKE
jgi:hypothetical protein